VVQAAKAMGICCPPLSGSVDYILVVSRVNA
jgi:hypothetical protein